jgi:hypothetical protein
MTAHVNVLGGRGRWWKLQKDTSTGHVALYTPNTNTHKYDQTDTAHSLFLGV